MKEYEIWIEEYWAIRGRRRPRFIGKSEGNNFEEALENFRYPDGKYLKFKKIRYTDARIIFTIYGCRLYDNEKDARTSFIIDYCSSI